MGIIPGRSAPRFSILILAALSMILCSQLAVPALADSFTVQSLGEGVPIGINDLGQVVGYFGDHALVYQNGSYETLSYSGEQITMGRFGQISAEYWDGRKWNPTIYVQGSFDPVTLAGVRGHSTAFKGINNWGQIVRQTTPFGLIGGIGYIGTPNRAAVTEPSALACLCIGLSVLVLILTRQTRAMSG